jgi:hypothetical protein
LIRTACYTCFFLVSLSLSSSTIALESPTQIDYLHLTDDGVIETTGLNGTQLAGGFTFSGWFYFKQLPSERRFLAGNNWEYNLVIETAGDGTLTIWFLQANVELDDVPLNQWINLAVTREGTTAKFFMDGLLLSESAVHSGVIEFPDSEHDRFALGGYWGYAKQIKMWDRTLDGGELMEQVGVVDSSPSSPLHQWLLDEGVGNVMADTGTNASADLTDPYGHVFWSNIHSPYEVLAQSHLISRVPQPLVHVWGVADFDQDGRKEVFVHGGDDYINPDQEAMLIIKVGEDNSLSNVSAELIEGGLFEKNFPSGRETIVDDLNGDGFDDIFYVNSAGHGNVIWPELPSLLLSDGTQGMLFPSENTIKSPPCTLMTPAFSGQKPCQTSDAGGLVYPDLNAPLVSLDDRANGHGGAAGDIDGDGDLDLFNMIASGASRDVKPVAPYFLINDGQGQFTADWQIVPFKAFNYWTELFTLPDGSEAMRDNEYPITHMADLDGDGYQDLVLVGTTTEAVMQLPPETPFSVETERAWESIYDLIAWGDAGGFSEQYTILYPGSIPDQQALTMNAHLLSMDIEGDGDLDLILGRDRPEWLETKGHYIQIFRNEGGRVFVDKTSELIPQTAEEIMQRPPGRGFQEYDFNHDGCPDFALSIPPQFIAEGNLAAPYRLWLNDCTGKFTAIRDSYVGKMGLLLPVDIDQDGGLDFVSLARGFNFGPYITATILKQTAEPKLEYFVDTDGDGVMDAYDSDNDMPINAGHSGAWFNPETSGQGQLIDIEPASQFMFLAWFTYTEDGSENPNQQHWFTAQGIYSGSEAVLPVYETLGGQFDDPAEVDSPVLVGSIKLTFESCTSGQANYSIDSWGVTGSFPLSRVIPGSENVCLTSAGAASTEPLNQNDVWDGAWYNEDTSGQGFLIDSLSNSAGDDFIFVAWFTYGDTNASGQRWLTAQGPLTGNQAEITVYEISGGSFDDPTPVNPPEEIGTMNIEFTGCNTAQLSYDLTDEGLSGNMDIIRLIPGTEALCENLPGSN